jgi:aminopeptidase N
MIDYALVAAVMENFSVMRIDTAQTIHRKDYTPPNFFVEAVEIGFDLEPGLTRVSARMQLRRNLLGLNSTLMLHGEQLTLVQIRLNNKNLNKNDYRLTATSLEISDFPDAAVLEIETLTHPEKNTSLSGLYVSNNNFFTQCEAEGFRRITYFPDRPDVMAKFTVMLRADKEKYPVLLSNGNLIEQGELENGRHYAKWEDPFKKPSYLFALVAGKLVCQEEWITQPSGHKALLQVWVEEGNLDKTDHALQSLKHSIDWDAKRFGLELDLDRFMIVAVSDFNMGAMENKGLNIFNTKFVLANPRIATDTDYANIESVVGHEYFHNWTGNRVTCRDWFQLSLKEGLTVFRDQEFSGDMVGTSSGKAVKRIEDVRLLRQVQFPEDAGPMAHPVRPDAYVEINNFYTVTVYEKGSEVVRMYQTILGRDGFRKGMDLYFARHDGQAVTCDDFRAAMADANKHDLTQFERWYSQAGTPRVHAIASYDAEHKTYDLTLSQSCAGTAGEPEKLPFHIPFAIGLLDQNGRDLPLSLANSDDASTVHTNGLLLNLTREQQTFQFKNVASKPVPSLLRDFSAPVILEFSYTDSELAFLIANDSDAFNRWEASQRLAMRYLLCAVQKQDHESNEKALLVSYRHVLLDRSLDPAFREVVLTLPSQSTIAEEIAIVDPHAIYHARRSLQRALASAFCDDWIEIYQELTVHTPYSADAVSVAKRALKNLALHYLSCLPNDPPYALMQKQYQEADNMTDRFAALSCLIASNAPTQLALLEKFYTDFEGDALVIDKWFSVQATAPTTDVAAVRSLMAHPAFSATNPNRARSLVFSFCNSNPLQFHAIDGSGYSFWSEQVIAFDKINPQVAARLARSLDRWKKFAPVLKKKMQDALTSVAQASALSNDVREVVTKALAEQ